MKEDEHWFRLDGILSGKNRLLQFRKLAVETCNTFVTR